MAQTDDTDRKAAIHLLRSGKTESETAVELGRSLAWVYKWRKRYMTQGGWEALREQTRMPKHQPTKLSEEVCQAIRQARSELEAEASAADKLSYIGAHAVRARLEKKEIPLLPGLSSIERVLRLAGMVRPYHPTALVEVIYPHLCPKRPRQLIQIDIVPHFLSGGSCVSCFNAIDVVSRNATGDQCLSKRSIDAATFLILVWQVLGIPLYTQVDNEACFSGGYSHPAVIGKVVRLALLVGTQLVFSPFYHPKSNAFVERFHQDYNQHVWKKVQLSDLAAVRQQSTPFFDAYRLSRHHSALNGSSPADIHATIPSRCLPVDFQLPLTLPITAGQVHFIRRVTQDHTVSVLNLNWDVSAAEPDQGVWVTLTTTTDGATLHIYDAAPDATQRICLAEHPFSLKEPVQLFSPILPAGS